MAIVVVGFLSLGLAIPAGATPIASQETGGSDSYHTAADASKSQTATASPYPCGSPAIESLPDFRSPTDPDVDCQYEDVNGDRVWNAVDVQALFVNQEFVKEQNDSVQAQFDFNGNGDFTVVDVQALFIQTNTLNPLESNAEQHEINVKGGSLPFDPALTFARTQRQLGTNVSPPATIELKNISHLSKVGDSPELFQLLGVESGPKRADGPEGTVVAYSTNDKVVLNTDISSTDSELESVLAHEYTHIVHRNTGDFEALYSEVRNSSGKSLDATTTLQAISEGGASYEKDAYQRTYQIRPRTELEIKADQYQQTMGSTKYAYGKYYFGERYVKHLIDTPRRLSSVFQNPPQTTEEIIHLLSPGSESPVSLSVNATDSEWNVTGQETNGELFVRAALDAELNRSQTDRAASGWGNDRRVSFKNGDKRGVAWTLRWDDASDATEFVRAMTAYLDRYSEQTNDGWRKNDVQFNLQRAGNRTTVLYAGAPTFVDDTTASTTDGNVTLDPGT